MTPRAPAAARALAPFIAPPGGADRFLASCLGMGPAPEPGSLEGVVRDHGDPALLPLLALDPHPRATPGDSALLRAAAEQERARGRAFEAATAAVAEAVREMGVEAILLPGAALAVPAYGGWDVRHSHDLDLLVAESEAERLRAAEIPLHGVSLEVHSRLLSDAPGGLPFRAAAGLAAPAGFADGLLALRPEAAAAYVLAKSAGRRRRALRWAADIAALAGWGRFAGRDLDWDGVAHELARDRASLIGWLRLAWLRERLGAEVPAGALEALAAHIRADPAQADELLGPVAEAAPGRPAALLRAAGPAAALRVAGHLAYPTAEHLGVRPAARPAAAAGRAARYLRRVVPGRARWLAARIRRGLVRVRTFVP